MSTISVMRDGGYGPEMPLGYATISIDEAVFEIGTPVQDRERVLTAEFQHAWDVAGKDLKNKMSYPTLLSPWYVVQEIVGGPPPGVRYSKAQEEDSPDMWTVNPHEAMLFMSLQSASRFARAVGGEVRVLTSKDDLKEFRPEGEV